VSFVTTTADMLSTSFDFTLELSCTFQVLLFVALYSVVRIPSVVDAPSNDSVIVSLTITAVLLFMQLVGTLEFSANDDAATEVTKSDDIIPDCRSA
jgi:hypothetical protein